MGLIYFCWLFSILLCVYCMGFITNTTILVWGFIRHVKMKPCIGLKQLIKRFERIQKNWISPRRRGRWGEMWSFWCIFIAFIWFLYSTIAIYLDIEYFIYDTTTTTNYTASTITNTIQRLLPLILLLLPLTILLLLPLLLLLQLLPLTITLLPPLHSTSELRRTLQQPSVSKKKLNENLVFSALVVVVKN